MKNEIQVKTRESPRESSKLKCCKLAMSPLIFEVLQSSSKAWACEKCPDKIEKKMQVFPLGQKISKWN